MRAARFFAGFVFVAVFVMLAASGGAMAEDAAASVAGKVIVNGKPLPHGRIFFHFGNGQFVGAHITNGVYKIDRLPTGKRPVTVEFPNGPGRYADEKQSGLVYEAERGAGQYDVQLKFK